MHTLLDVVVDGSVLGNNVVSVSISLPNLFIREIFYLKDAILYSNYA